MKKSGPEKLTRAIEKKITQDWAKEFPGLAVYKPRWLLRRAGPLLVGICLDRDSHGDQYKPCFHVHFLGIESPCPVPVLTLDTVLRTPHTHAPDWVEVRWHEEKYLDAVVRMAEQSLLPLEGALTVDQVIAAYRRYMQTPMGSNPQSMVMLMCDVILLLCWCGRKAEAEAALNFVLARFHEDRAYRHRYGNQDAFEQAMRRAIEDPGTVQKVVESEVERLGVENLPVSELVC